MTQERDNKQTRKNKYFPDITIYYSPEEIVCQTQILLITESVLLLTNGAVWNLKYTPHPQILKFIPSGWNITILVEPIKISPYLNNIYTID